MKEETSYCHFMDYLFDQQKGVFYMNHPRDRITYTPEIPVVEDWVELEQIFFQCVQHEVVLIIFFFFFKIFSV